VRRLQATPAGRQCAGRAVGHRRQQRRPRLKGRRDKGSLGGVICDGSSSQFTGPPCPSPAPPVLPDATAPLPARFLLVGTRPTASLISFPRSGTRWNVFRPEPRSACMPGQFPPHHHTSASFRPPTDHPDPRLIFSSPQEE
jgi:hypothetical protein